MLTEEQYLELHPQHNSLCTHIVDAALVTYLLAVNIGNADSILFPRRNCSDTVTRYARMGN